MTVLNTTWSNNNKQFETSGQFTTTLKQSVDVGSITQSNNHGAVWDGINTTVVEGGSTSDKLHLFSGKFTSTLKTSIDVSSIAGFPRGGKWNGFHTLLSEDPFSSAKLYRVSGQFSTTIKTSATVPAGVDTANGDLEWDGANTPISNAGATDKLVLISGAFTATIKTSQDIGSIDTVPYGISFNGTDTPWSGQTDDKHYMTSGQFSSTLKTSASVATFSTIPRGISDTWQGRRLGTDRVYCLGIVHQQNSTNPGSSTVTTTSFEYGSQGCSDPGMIAVISWIESGVTLTDVDWDAAGGDQAFTIAGQDNSATGQAAIVWLASPDEETTTITCTFSGSLTDEFFITVYSVANMHQTTGMADFESDSSSGTGPTNQTVTTDAEDMGIDVIMKGSNTAITFDGSQLQRGNQIDAAGDSLATSIIEGSGTTVSMGCSWSGSENYVYAAAAVKFATANNNVTRAPPQGDLAIDMKTPTATVPSFRRQTDWRFRGDGAIGAP